MNKYNTVETSEGVMKVYFRNEVASGSGGSESLTPKQRMDLMTCKTLVKEESKKDKKRIFYIDIDDEGECLVVKKCSPSSTFYAYRNGQEIPLIIEPVSNNKQSSEDGNLENSMEVTVGKAAKSGKKSASKVAAKKGKSAKKSAASKDRKPVKVEGVKKSLSVKAIRAEIKAGKVVRLASGFYFSEAFLATKADQDKKHDVFVKG